MPPLFRGLRGFCVAYSLIENLSRTGKVAPVSVADGAAVVVFLLSLLLLAKGTLPKPLRLLLLLGDTAIAAAALMR